MIARLDEFEALTPLMITPTNGNNDDTYETAPTMPSSTQTTLSSSSRQALRRDSGNSNRSNDSPPLVRRPPMGTTLVVPLTSANRPSALQEMSAQMNE